MSILQPSKKIGKEFQNPVPTINGIKGSGWKLFMQYMTNKAEVIPKKRVGPFKTDTSVYQKNPDTGLRVTWMGHSGLLIEIDGTRILTDPVWSSRASFVNFAGPKRFFSAPVDIDKLPELDAIIISHDHYDHLDKPTIKKLANTNIPFYTTLGVSAILQKWGINKSRITEMDWMDSVSINKDCTITALPTRHFSGRGVRNRNQTLWASFVIKTSGHNIYYGADSGWHPGFAEIGEAFGPFDLTMLEIGAYGDSWPDIHMGPIHAINAHLALKGKVMMPIHWGTFNLALHDWREPVERLEKYAREKDITYILPAPGKPHQIDGRYHNSKWWE